MSTEERDESQPRPKKVIPSIRRENTDQEGERRPYNQGYNRPEGKVATTAAARLMEITARHMGMEEGNTIVRLVLIMMDRQRLIPLVLPERECLRMV